MSNITIKFKDGRVRDFPHVGRAGGSWTKTVKYEGGFAIVTDEYEKQYAFPAEDIEEVVSTPIR